jgi:hypothetical protein
MTGRPDYRRGETGGTREPENEIRAVLDDTEGQYDEAALVRILRGMATALEGALADIRATRALLEAPTRSSDCGIAPGRSPAKLAGHGRACGARRT